VISILRGILYSDLRKYMLHRGICEWILKGNAFFARINKNPIKWGIVEFCAQAYARHQFGHFIMLGDGRALLLG
jgi:uncharacterized protein YdiU (UPF0061 family)